MKFFKYLVPIIVFFILLAKGIDTQMTMPAVDNIQGQDKEPRRVEIWMAESVERIVGFEWGKSDGQPLMMAAIQEPAYLIIHLPSGKVIESFTMGATMDNDDGFVSQVVLQPLPELAKSYEEVVEAAETIVRDWDIDNAELEADLAHWREMYDEDPLLLDPDKRYPNRSLKRYASAEIELDISLTPERAIHYSNEGWYLQMNLHAGYAIDRKMGREVRKPRKRKTDDELRLPRSPDGDQP